MVKHDTTIYLTGTASDNSSVKTTAAGRNAVECGPIKTTATTSTAVKITTVDAADAAVEGSITQPTTVNDSLLNLSSSLMDISSCSSSSELSESGECYKLLLPIFVLTSDSCLETSVTII